MRIRNLFYAFLALPLFFVACEENKVDEVKNPTVAVTAGEATETSVSFTVTSTDAEKVAWVVVEATATAPTATEVINAGKVIAANDTVEVTATDLKADTEYLVVAAAMNKKSVVKSEKTMTTLKGADDPNDDPNDNPNDDPNNPNDDPNNPNDDPSDKVEFVATNIFTDFMIEEGAEFYAVELGDKEWDDKGWGVDGGTYYGFFIAPAVKGNGKLPNGIYTLSSVAEPNTIIDEFSYHYKMVNGVPDVTYGGLRAYKDAVLTITDGKVEAEVEFENGEIHHVVFEGDLSVDDGGNSGTPGEFKATHTADKWLWGGGSDYGNKYVVSGEGFSLDVHFPAEYATENKLEAGEYIWTNTSWWGYNDFENEFTTCEFLIDGAYSSIVRSGEALVAVEGEEYHIQLTLVADDAVYMVEYEGKLNDVGEVVTPDKITFAAMDKGVKLTDNTLKYLLKDESGKNLVNIVFENTVATETSITAGNYAWAGSPVYVGSSNFSFVNKSLVIDGQAHANSEISTGSCDVAVEGNVYTIVTKVEVLGTEYTLEYVGTIGDPNEGGEEPENPGGGEEPENPGEGGEEPENPGDGGETPGDGGETTGTGYENWVFTASLSSWMNGTLTLTDGSHNVTCKLNQLAATIPVGDMSGFAYAYDFTVDGVAVDITKVSGNIYLDMVGCYISIDLVIDGVKYTGTSTNAVA